MRYPRRGTEKSLAGRIREFIWVLMFLSISIDALAQVNPGNVVIAFDAAANADIKKIVILKSSKPAILVERMGAIEVERGAPVSVGAFFVFGAIGGLAAAGAGEKIRADSKEVSAKFKALGFDLHDVYADEMKNALERAGYEARVVTVERTMATKLVADLTGVGNADEAVLDLGIVMPRIARGKEGTRLLPGFATLVRLARPGGQTVVYRAAVSYSDIPRTLVATLIPLDDKYAFENYDALLQNDKLAVEAYQVGAAAVAERIAADLKRRE